MAHKKVKAKRRRRRKGVSAIPQKNRFNRGAAALRLGRRRTPIIIIVPTKGK